jgi:hypothetical protein
MEVCITLTEFPSFTQFIVQGNVVVFGETDSTVNLQTLTGNIFKALISQCLSDGDLFGCRQSLTETPRGVV